jgi:cobalamin biosynthesis protein CbiG
MTTLSIGIGCRSGSTAAQIEQAVRAALTACHAFEQISVVASIDAKAHEPGLLDFCARHALPLRCFTREQIAAIPLDGHSAAARERFGVDGVCEPCALLAAVPGGTARLIVRKSMLNGVTVAVATSHASTFHDNQDLS